MVMTSANLITKYFIRLVFAESHALKKCHKTVRTFICKGGTYIHAHEVNGVNFSQTVSTPSKIQPLMYI